MNASPNRPGVGRFPLHPGEAAGVSRPRAHADPAGTASVVLERASVQLGGRTVWRDVDVAVGSGEFVAVLGPNGVGKSTLVKVLLGLVPLASGRVQVLGRAPAEARRRVGYLP